MSDVKTEPRSDVMCSGRPNLLIQASSRAVAHDTVVASSIGIASGHLVDLSMIVNRYRFPSELGSGPTISTCMCPKRRVGCWKLPRDALVCLCILLRWQLTHVRVQAVIPFFIACQTNFSVTSCTVARMDGWDKVWIISKMFRLKHFGTNGRGLPVLMSQSREVSPIFTTFHLRLVIDVLASSVSGSVSWAAARS